MFIISIENLCNIISYNEGVEMGERGGRVKPIGNLGNVVDFLSKVRGEAPAKNDVCAISKLK